LLRVLPRHFFDILWLFLWFLFYRIGVMIGIIWVDLCKGLTL